MPSFARYLAALQQSSTSTLRGAQLLGLGMDAASARCWHASAVSACGQAAALAAVQWPWCTPVPRGAHMPQLPRSLFLYSLP